VNPPQSEVSAAWPPVWLTMFSKSSPLLALPSTLAPLPVMLGETRWPRGFCASLWLWVHCQRAINRSLPSCLTSEGTDDGTSGPVIANAVPDSYSGSFLSHNMEPVEQVLGLRAEVELEIPDCLAPIGEKLDLLVHLEALGLEEFEEAALRFLIISLYKGEACA
jgi:hypothetical protein